ncbi:hypothetical protein K2173_001344 [Erythroxylum novogranatense]|uniref:Uncharacterized protein n=1 Tax=Erythroxylum novogranatense TaxID=1862640 RepID=A0AAV8T503_9ROSI|nr:hypothetical protein K2173_001344 [Erythroxylum novogranatense]
MCNIAFLSKVGKFCFKIINLLIPFLFFLIRFSHCGRWCYEKNQTNFIPVIDSSDVDSFGDGATKQLKDLANKLNGKFANVMTSILAKGKKGRKFCTETSLEEIVNLNEEPVGLLASF